MTAGLLQATLLRMRMQAHLRKQKELQTSGAACVVDPMGPHTLHICCCMAPSVVLLTSICPEDILRGQREGRRRLVLLIFFCFI